MVREGRRRCIQQRRSHNNDDSIAPLVKHRHCIRCYIKYSGSGGPSHGWRRTCYQTCTLLCYINSHAHLGGSYHSDPIIYFPTHFWLWKLLWHPTTLSTPATSTWFHFPVLLVNEDVSLLVSQLSTRRFTSRVVNSTIVPTRPTSITNPSRNQ